MISLRNLSLAARRQLIEKKTGQPLKAVKKMPFLVAEVEGRHCENLIGATSVPLGVAGPLKISYQGQVKEFFVPLATTEGALIASVNRGMKAISKSGGAGVVVKRVGVTRAPVFAVDSVEAGRELIDWLDKNRSLVKKTAKGKEKHLDLIDFQTWQLGRWVYLRLSFDTQEAMGMNMATFATERAVAFIEAKTKVRCLSLSGNVCADKKPTGLNSVLGRGRQVWLEVEVSQKTLGEVLKTDPARLVETAQAKLVGGGLVAGQLGANAHLANIAAAFFLATGQDPAHVVEASQGVTQVKLTKKGVLFSLFLPAILVGTVGGGTRLPAQREALAILGFEGAKPGSADWLAAVLGGACLAGEISLLAALSASQLCQAHLSLGRGGKK